MPEVPHDHLEGENMRNSIRHSLFCVSLLILTHSLLGQSNPIPFLEQPLVPVSAAPGSPAITLTVNGSGFVSTSAVLWNGTALPTSFVNTSQVTASVPSSNLASVGTATVTVSNPAPGGGVSNSVPFTLQAPVAGSPLFTIFPQSDSLLANAQLEVAGDFNADGKLDLAGVIATNPGVDRTTSAFVKLGNGDGSFQPAKLFAVGNSDLPLKQTMRAADFNADGKLDLAVVNNVDSTVSVLLGNGDGTLKAAANFAVPSSGLIFAADMNRDGKLDLIVGTNSGSVGAVSILLGNGDGTFQAHADKFTGTTVVSAFAIADINRDGNLDIVAADDSNPHGLSVLEGRGDGTFNSPIVSTFTETPYGTLTGMYAADFNADGVVDLAIGVRGAVGNGTFLLLGNGDGTFAASIFTGVFGFLDGMGDFNGDGKLDLAAGDFHFQTNGSTNIGLGTGTGTFQLLSISGLIPGVVGDFNNDGALDIANINNVLPDTTTHIQVLIQGLFEDFTLGLSMADVTISAGKSTDVTLDVTPVGGFSQTVNLSCSGLPVGVTCSFTPASVTFSGATTQEVKVTFTGASSMVSLNGSPFRFPSALFATLLMSIVPGMVFSLRKKKGNGSVVSCVLAFWCLLVLGTVMSGCGGGSGNGGGGGGGLTPGTSIVTLNASSALTPSVTHAATVTLTVQ
jgi:hypothetical protein